MPSTSHDLTISTAQADALFASPLQRSDEPSATQVRQAIATAIGVHGVRGCAARVAQAYGEHPETALPRMRWALTAVASAFGVSPQRAVRPVQPDLRVSQITTGIELRRAGQTLDKALVLSSISAWW